jgi:3-oxoadipate CoA-transferase beta subunit
MMQHQDKDGAPKIVPECTYPLTGARVVDRIYTDLAVVDVQPEGLWVRGMVRGLTFEQLQQRTGVPLRRAGDCAVLEP